MLLRHLYFKTFTKLGDLKIYSRSTTGLAKKYIFFVARKWDFFHMYPKE